LGLLALQEAAPHDRLLDLAQACGAHLLRKRRETAHGYRAWLGAHVNAVRPLAGFGHGAAGIACALLRLYAHTGDETLYDAAVEGIAYENTLYTADSNWQDG